jgi:hypothetical protein
LESEKDIHKNKRIFWEYPGKWGPYLIKNNEKIRPYEMIPYKNPNLFSGKKNLVVMHNFRRSDTKTQNVL